MEPSDNSGFTLWLRSAGATIDFSSVVAEIAHELAGRGVPVEPINVALLARTVYREKVSGQGLVLAIAMSADALTRHGVACLIHGSRSSAQEFAWKKRKPERILDVVLVREGETVAGKGPYLVLRPKAVNDTSSLPDPPSSAPVEGQQDQPVTRSEQHSPTADHSESDSTDSDAPLIEQWDLAPLFDALAKAGWIPPLTAPTNGDDELLRQRLKKLGYL